MTPIFDTTLIQSSDGQRRGSGAVQASLEHSMYASYSTRFKFGGFGYHVNGEIKSDVFRAKNCTVSRATVRVHKTVLVSNGRSRVETDVFEFNF